MLKRLVLALATLLACAAVFASTTAERSPFTQGHWWDSSTPGSGFEIFNAGDQVMVIWYTYDAGSRPVWYTAQGSLADVGRRPWALLRHGWANGRKAAAAEVGTLRLNVESTDAARVEWSVGGASGAASIAPFVVSGWAYYPWRESGLVRFEVRGSDAASARLVQLAPLISHRAGTQGQAYFADPAVDSGRSILFRGATLYIGNGQFWKQDSAGNTAGPY